MNASDIAHIRLNAQQITDTHPFSPKELVEWLGAVQAQDLPMAMWALGVRMPDSTVQTIENAFNTGEIIRTHAMRPTWHFISSDDIYWMLELTAPQIKSALNYGQRYYEFTPELINKSISLLEHSLKDGERSKTELVDIFHQNNFRTDENRMAHFLMHAELAQIVCSGTSNGRTQNYALLSNRVPIRKILPREEALVKLTKRYFYSHGPATLTDFAWWSGLPMKDIRTALEHLKNELDMEVIHGTTYYFKHRSFVNKTSCYFLPAFDEYLVSYRHRDAVITDEHHKKTISSNGIFRPIIVKNGKVVGLWKQSLTKTNFSIDTELFYPEEMIDAETAIIRIKQFWRR